MNTVMPPAGESEAVDRWGNLRSEPHRVIEERHDGHFIKIFIYAYGGGFYYGYQLKVGTMISQKAANTAGEVFGTAETARTAASAEIERLCGMNKNVKKLFADFTRIRYCQRGLFGDD